MESIRKSLDEEFCRFVGALDLIQLERLIEDVARPAIGFQIIEHLKTCPSGECTKVGEAWQRIQNKKFWKLWDALSEEEKHRHILEVQATGFQMIHDQGWDKDPVVRHILQSRDRRL